MVKGPDEVSTRGSVHLPPFYLRAETVNQSEESAALPSLGLLLSGSPDRVRAHSPESITMSQAPCGIVWKVHSSFR